MSKLKEPSFKYLDPWQLIIAQTLYKVFDTSENTIGVLDDDFLKSSNEELID